MSMGKTGVRHGMYLLVDLQKVGISGSSKTMIKLKTNGARSKIL